MNGTIIGLIQKIPFFEPDSKLEKRYSGEDPIQKTKIYTDKTLEITLFEMLMGQVIN